MEKIIYTIKNNRVLNIMLNPSGTISRKEYWFGLIMLLSFSSIRYSELLLNSLLVSFNYDLYRSNEVIYMISQANTVFGPLFNLPLIPYTFLTLYSSFILTFKRSRGYLNRPLQCLFSLSSYLIFSSIASFINLQAYWSIEMYSISNPFFMQLYILPSILFVLGLVSIIILSCIRSEPESIRDNHYGSINVVFKLFIAQVIFSSIATIIIFTAPTFKIFNIPCIILIAALYIITFLYLITKRAIDAMIPGYVPILIVFGASMIAGGYFYIANTHTLSLSIFTLSIPSIFVLLFSILNILYLILIVLPSKRKDLDDEQYFE